MSDPLEGLSPEARRELLQRMLRERAAPPREFPLSFEQRRLWFLCQLSPQSPLYNEFAIVRLAGRLDEPALGAALEGLVARHEVLRTRYELRPGAAEPIQVVDAPGPVRVEQRDLSGHAEEVREAELTRECVAYTNLPFDLERGPIVRFLVCRLGATEHVLLVALHHIAYDGWSSGLICGDIARLYARALGADVPLEELSVQYGDFASWQREKLEGESLAESLEACRRRLTGIAPLELPTDHPRPPQTAYAGSRESLRLPASFTRRLESLRAESSTTHYVVLLAAFQVLLHRYTGQTDLAVGSLFANRNKSELENLVGCFVNTLVVRCDLSGDPSFRDLVARVHAEVLEMTDRRELPFDLVVEAVDPPRELGRNPLFDVSFVVMAGERHLVRAGELEFREQALDPETCRFDLEVYAFLREDGVELMFNYRTDLFAAESVRRMLAHFERLLGAAVEDPEAPISRLPLFSESEREAVLHQWNATERELPAESIPCAFEEQARRAPDRVAVEFEGDEFSYGELDRRAERLAHLLLERGLAKGDRVGLCLERSAPVVVGMLAVWKAGGAWVPLDPDLPGERLTRMLDDAGARLVLTETTTLEANRALRRYLRKSQGAAVCVDVEEPSGAPAGKPAVERVPGDLAYVIFTSGSTGRPKGVEVGHESVVNFLRSMAREPGLTPDDVLLAVTNITFDISVLELFGPLSVGGRVVLASRELAADARALAERLGRGDVTSMQATPATWRLLVQAGWKGDGRLRALCGGEALPRALAEELLERAAAVWNLYGPTETTVWSTLARVGPGDGPVPIGRPIDNTRVHVLDGALEPTPIGVPGDLYIGGRGLALGYHGRPDWTAERFVPDPFGADGERLYRTGDRARRLATGELQFLGRNDHQIKLRGFRIELEEIEAVLLAHPELDACVAQPFEAGPGDTRLAAWVVGRGAATPSAEELRTFAARSLPGYMVPAAVVTLDALPLTTSGKVDRRALPRPELTRPEHLEPRQEPRTEMERALAEVWTEVLGVDQVSTYDHFFDLGGHSLLTIRASAELERRTGVRVELREFFLQTLGQMAAGMESRRAQAGGVS